MEPIKRADLPPDEDAYSLSSYNLYKYHTYSHKLLGNFYPPVIPFGYPLMIIPFYMIFGLQPYNAVYCSLFFSLLSIVFIYLIGKRVANRPTGVVAALFLTLCPLHIIYGKKIMSESLSTFLYLFVFWLFLKAIEHEQKRNVSLLLFMGLIIGFSVSVRYANMLIYPAIIVSLIYARNFKFKLSIKEGVIVSIGVLIALIPIFIYNYHAYGNPFSTGYIYWRPWMKFNFLYSLKYFAQSLPSGQKGNFIFYLNAFLGIGIRKYFYPLTILPLTLIGGFSIVLKNRKVISTSKILLMFTVAITSFHLIFYSFYRFQAFRFFLETIPFLFLIAAYSIGSNVPWHKFKWFSKRTLLSGVSCILALVAIGQMVNYLDIANVLVQNRQYKIVKEADKYLEKNAIIISHLKDIVAEHYFTENSNRIYILADIFPYNRNVIHLITDYHKKPVLRSDNIASCKRHSYLFRNNKNVNPLTLNFIYFELRRGRPVYFLDSPRNFKRKEFFTLLKEYFIAKKHKENPQLYRLYIKHW